MRISDWSSDVCSSDLMPVMLFLSDHRAETIDRVVAAVKQFRTANDAYDVDFRVKQDAALAAAEVKGEEYHSDKVNLRLATGNVGVLAAINDTVRKVEHYILWTIGRAHV